MLRLQHAQLHTAISSRDEVATWSPKTLAVPGTAFPALTIAATKLLSSEVPDRGKEGGDNGGTSFLTVGGWTISLMLPKMCPAQMHFLHPECLPLTVCDLTARRCASVVYIALSLWVASLEFSPRSLASEN